MDKKDSTRRVIQPDWIFLYIFFIVQIHLALLAGSYYYYFFSLNRMEFVMHSTTFYPTKINNNKRWGKACEINDFIGD
jgi:hypothetical protein